MSGDVTRKWNQLFDRSYIKNRIMNMAETYPETSSLSLNMKELNAFEIWDDLIDNPDEVLKKGIEVLVQHIKDTPFPDVPDIISEQLLIRPVDGETKLRIREIRQRHTGRLIELEGLIRRCSKPELLIVNAAYRCMRCDHVFHLSSNGMVLPEPGICANPNCDREGPFRFLQDESVFVDAQRFNVQETFDNLEDGRHEPQSIDVLLKGDLSGKVLPGSKVRIVGVLRLQKKGAKSRKSTTFTTYLDGLYVETEGSDYGSLELSDEDKKVIMEEAARSDHMERLIQSVAPSILGLEPVKLGLLAQQVGGCEINMPDKCVSRGDLHILLVGDPSMGKSYLLQYIFRLSPRCSMGAGGGASGVGLTATVSKDNLEGWVLDAGVLPMANGGLAIVDEFDKLGDDDRAKLHEALEQGEIHIDKASVHAVLPTKCAVLAAANPKLGRFDMYESLPSQINLTPALLSRFDLIFLMRDAPDAKNDEEISWHILSGAKEVDPPLNTDLLRKFLAYAKKIRPEMTEAANRKIQKFYVGTRRKSYNGNSVSIIPRSIHSIRRVAEAIAKLRLSNQVTEEDVETAINVYYKAFRPIISTEEGGMDVDLLDLGISKLSRDRTKVIKEIIRKLSQNGGAIISRIMEEADKASIPGNDAMEILKRLKKNGDVMEMRGAFQVTE